MENTGKMKLILLIIIIASCSLFAADGDRGLGGTFLNSGTYSRQLSLGNAYCGLPNDISSMYYNPAGLTKLYKSEIALTHITLFEDTVYDYIGFAYPTVYNYSYGIGLMQLNVPDIQLRDSNNKPLDTTTYKNSAVFISAGAPLGKIFSYGMTVKILSKEFEKVAVSATKLDVGMLFSPNPKFGIGLNFQNLLDSRFAREGGYDTIPMNIKFGIGLIPVSNKTFEMTILCDTDKTENISRTIIHAGIEFKFFNTVALRAGSDDGNITAGAGFRIKDFKLDCAMLTHQSLGNSMRVSMGLFFGKLPEEREELHYEWKQNKLEEFWDSNTEE